MKNTSHSNILADARRIINDNTPFAVKEAYRTLYTNLMYLPIESSCKKIVFTSAYPGEGKTSVSINIAYTIANTSPEVRVLLIDADMRSPRVAQLLGIDAEEKHGLSEFLAGIDETPNLTETIYPNLSLLTSGAESVNTPALLASSKVEKLAAYCEANYDYVIIDTPPINVVSDAIFLSGHVDGYVIVTRADYSDINSVSDAVDKLVKVDAKVLGSVLCSLDTKRMTGYGKYGKYDGYSKYDTSKYPK